MQPYLPQFPDLTTLSCSLQLDSTLYGLILEASTGPYLRGPTYMGTGTIPCFPEATTQAIAAWCSLSAWGSYPFGVTMPSLLTVQAQSQVQQDGHSKKQDPPADILTSI